MKKLTVVLLIVLLALVMASCDRSNAPGEGGLPPVGESGSPEGTYTFSFKYDWCDSINMELTFSGDSVSVTKRAYTDTYNYVKWEDIYYGVGSYSLDGSGNIAIDVNQATQKSEFYGSEENVAEYIAEQKYYNTIAFEDDNEITQQEYDKMMALLAGETVDLDAANISLTVRLDTENEKFYLIEVNQGNNEPKVNFTYHENGTVKTLKEDWGDSEIYVIEYDENGNAIADDDTLYEYDEQGRMVVQEFLEDGGIYKTRFEQEFNEEGVCILRKEYHYYNDELEMYLESKQLTYLTVREIYYDFESYTFEDKKMRDIRDVWNRNTEVKSITPFYDESGEVYEYDVIEYDESQKAFDRFYLNKLCEKTYDGQGILKYAVYFDENGDTAKKIYYFLDGSKSFEWTPFGDGTYDGEWRSSDGEIFACARISWSEYDNGDVRELDFYLEDGTTVKRIDFDESGRVTYEYMKGKYFNVYEYYENGQLKDSDKNSYLSATVIKVERITYDENGNVIESETYTYDENE